MSFIFKQVDENHYKSNDLDDDIIECQGGYALNKYKIELSVGTKIVLVL